MNVDSGLVRAQMTKRDRHNQSSHELKRSCDILRLRQSTCAQVFQHTLGSSQFVWRCDAGSLSEITDAMLKHLPTASASTNAERFGNAVMTHRHTNTALSTIPTSKCLAGAQEMRCKIRTSESVIDRSVGSPNSVGVLGKSK